MAFSTLEPKLTLPKNFGNDISTRLNYQKIKIVYPKDIKLYL